MQVSYSKNRVVLKWFGDELLKEISNVKEKDEKEAADRIHRLVFSKVPTGSYVRSFRPTYQSFKAKKGIRTRMKSWQQRMPGLLKMSVQKYKSKFAGGGYVIMAGNYLAWYARIVEYGTKMRRQKTTGRFTGRAKASRYMRKALLNERARFIAKVKSSMQMLKGMNE
jgi:hypothetical protein